MKELQQTSVQHFSNSYSPMRDLIEYHNYTAYGVVENEKIVGFCKIVWKMEFSGAYLPLKHIHIGIADTEYKHNRDLEQAVPTIKYGVYLLCRSDKIERADIMADTESVLLITRNQNDQITFVGEHTDGIRNGFGVEISYNDTKYSMLYGFWKDGSLKYQHINNEWKEV